MTQEMWEQRWVQAGRGRLHVGAGRGCADMGGPAWPRRCRHPSPAHIPSLPPCPPLPAHPPSLAARLDKIQGFFGPGITARLTETPQGMDVALVSDGSGAGRGGGEKKDVLVGAGRGWGVGGWVWMRRLGERGGERETVCVYVCVCVQGRWRKPGRRRSCRRPPRPLPCPARCSRPSCPACRLASRIRRQPGPWLGLAPAGCCLHPQLCVCWCWSPTELAPVCALARPLSDPAFIRFHSRCTRPTQTPTFGGGPRPAVAVAEGVAGQPAHVQFTSASRCIK